MSSGKKQKKRKSNNRKKGKAAFLWDDTILEHRAMTLGVLSDVHRELSAGRETYEWLQMLLGDAERMMTNGITALEETLSPILVQDLPVNLARLASGTGMPGGVANELPYIADAKTFHDVLWHAYNQAVLALKIIKDPNLMLLDISGTTESALFNNEDVVYYDIEEDRIHMVDLTTNPNVKGDILELSTEDVAQFEPSIQERATGTNRGRMSAQEVKKKLSEGLVPEFQVKTAGAKLLSDLSKGLLSQQRKKPLAMLTAIISLSRKIPGCKVTYSIKKIARAAHRFIKVPPAIVGVREVEQAAMDLVDAMGRSKKIPDYDKVLKAVHRAVTEVNHKKARKGKTPPAGAAAVARGTGTVKDMLAMVTFMRETGMGNLVDKMHECYKHTVLQKKVTKGIPPPSADTPRKELDFRDHTGSVLAFLHGVKKDGEVGIVYLHTITGTVEAHKPGAFWGYHDIGFLDALVWCRKLQGKGSSKQHVSSGEVLQIGCSENGPTWLQEALMHGRRATPEVEPWEEFAMSDEALCEAISDDRNLVAKLALVNRINIPSAFDRASKLVSTSSGVPSAMRLVRMHAARLLSVIDSTVAGQMLNMNYLACLAVMRASRYRSKDNCFRLEEHAGGRIHTLAKITGHIAKWDGGNVVVFTTNAVDMKESSYVSCCDSGTRNTVTRSLMIHSAFLRKTAAAAAKVASVVSNAAHNANSVSPVSDLHLRMTIAHVAMLSLNARRSFGVSIYAARWMGNIASGMAGDLGAVAGKVMYATCVNRAESLTIAESVILRHGALAAIRDSWEKGAHMGPASDGSRSVLISPPGTWGITMTLQGYINSWYNAEATHGMHVDNDLANARVALAAAEIVRLSQLEENKVAGCGMPLVYYKDLVHSRRTATQIVDDDDFEEIMVEHAASVALSENKFAWSAYSTFATAKQNPVPAALWETIASSLTVTTMHEAMTSKRALVSAMSEDEPGNTDMACLAFSLPLVMASTSRYIHYRKEAKALMTESSLAYSGGSALTAFHMALAQGVRPCSQLVDKADSIEKMRIIAMMNMMLRWAALVIEVPSATILQAGRDGTMGYKLETSAMLTREKHAVMSKMRAKGFAKVKEDCSPRDKFLMIPIMNDCSGWGPYKVLASVYCSLVSSDAPESMRELLRLAFSLFMSKRFVVAPGVTRNITKVAQSLEASTRVDAPKKTGVRADQQTRLMPCMIKQENCKLNDEAYDKEMAELLIPAIEYIKAFADEGDSDSEEDEVVFDLRQAPLAMTSVADANVK
jgi:hypothetical protein